MKVKRKKHSEESKTHLSWGICFPRERKRKERYRLEWAWAPQGRVAITCLRMSYV